MLYFRWKSLCGGCFFFSSRRRHTRCALVTGVQTCALPIYHARREPAHLRPVDLGHSVALHRRATAGPCRRRHDDVGRRRIAVAVAIHGTGGALYRYRARSWLAAGGGWRRLLARQCPADRGAGENREHRPQTPQRSEEHKSELQSLMRISYAVFCLKKKKQTQTNNT